MVADPIGEMAAERFRGPADSPGFLLWQGANRWQRRLNAALRPLGLTHVQFVLLAVLAHQGGPATQVALARLCGIDPMTASVVLRGLERRGLVARTIHAEDSRAKAIVLNAAGGEALRRALPMVEKEDVAFFAALGTDVPAFTAALGRLGGMRARIRLRPARDAAPQNT